MYIYIYYAWLEMVIVWIKGTFELFSPFIYQKHDTIDAYTLLSRLFFTSFKIVSFALNPNKQRTQ